MISTLRYGYREQSPSPQKPNLPFYHRSRIPSSGLQITIPVGSRKCGLHTSTGSSPRTLLGTGVPLLTARAGAHIIFPGEPPAVPASNIRPGSGTSTVASNPMSFLPKEQSSNALLAAPPKSRPHCSPEGGGVSRLRRNWLFLV